MIKVLSSTFGLSVQDMGRFQFRSKGVPISGAMDGYSAKLGNLLLNNNEKDAVVEITFGGCKLQIETDCTICITGADFSAKINERRVSLNSVFNVKKDSILSFGKRVYGVRTYVAIKGGFQTEMILDSRSFYKHITPESHIRKGMSLPISPINPALPNACVRVNQEHFHSEIIDCFEGPEMELLSSQQKEKLLSTPFTISPNNNRMGYQLKELVGNKLPSMLTSAVLPGTVQLTPSGKLIILMRDCQVTGGYPRILQLTEASINRLAQKITGDPVRFILRNFAIGESI